MSYSPGTYALLWPPAYQQAAAAEGWQLRPVMRGEVIEVDYLPIPDTADITKVSYIELAKWLVLNAYVLGSPMHMIAWEFEYATNQSIYDSGAVPGDPEDQPDDNDGWLR